MSAATDRLTNILKGAPFRQMYEGLAFREDGERSKDLLNRIGVKLDDLANLVTRQANALVLVNGIAAAPTATIKSGSVVAQYDLINVGPDGAQRASAGSGGLPATHSALSVSGTTVTLGVNSGTVRFASGETSRALNTWGVVYLSKTAGRATFKIPQPSDVDFSQWDFVQAIGSARTDPNASLLATVDFRIQAQPNAP